MESFLEGWLVRATLIQQGSYPPAERHLCGKPAGRLLGRNGAIQGRKKEVTATAYREGNQRQQDEETA
ncbi:hypothetical protein DPMN_014019 [Dreissena polymorpha]|uniref:Uncharacterized protein n=1 Tax=Dreissena polymorpha TaxID=45954 RepID=A0A9D4S4U6_DREPO|nr:hypothetical protein DPMN_014019 [Dreissena polymorpha]